MLTGGGHVIDSKVSFVTELKPGGKDKTRFYADLTISDQGNFSGDLYYTYSEYAAYLFRKKFATFNDKNEYVRNFERENPGLHVTKSTFQAVDSIYYPLNAKYKIENFGNSDVSDSTISFVPFLVDRIKVNLFKSDDRKIPVDFIYSSEKNFIYKITIPSNYTVSHLPDPVNMVLPDNGGKFTYRVSAENETIVIQSNISFNKALFTQNEYPYIKQLYANIVAKQSEPIIIKKK